MPAVAPPHSRALLWLAAIAVVGAGGCRIGTDLPEEDRGALESEEALAISTAIVLATVENTVLSPVQTFFNHSHGLASVHSHPIAGPFAHESEFGLLPSHHNLFNEEFSFDLECAGGGSLNLAAAGVGEGNPFVQRAFIDYQLGHEPAECGILLANGARLVLSAPPYVTGEARVEYDGRSSAQISGTLIGGTRWETQAKAGECIVDISFLGVAATVEEITEVVVQGNVCDFDVGGTLEVG